MQGTKGKWERLEGNTPKVVQKGQSVRVQDRRNPRKFQFGTLVKARKDIVTVMLDGGGVVQCTPGFVTLPGCAPVVAGGKDDE